MDNLLTELNITNENIITLLVVGVTFIIVYSTLLALTHNGGNLLPDRSPAMQLIKKHQALSVQRIEKDDTDYFLVETENDKYVVKANYKNKRKTRFDFEKVPMSVISDKT